MKIIRNYVKKKRSLVSFFPLEKGFKVTLPSMSQVWFQWS